MTGTPQELLHPGWTVTTWDSSARTVRLTLPTHIDPDVDIVVGAVGSGWLELTDDTGAPGLEIPTTRQTRNRVALHSVGALMRFGGRYGDAVVVHTTGWPGRHLIRVVDLERVELKLPQVNRPALMSASGWDDLWRGVLDSEA